MPDKKFELGEYIEVKDRIAIFYELYPQGRLMTVKVRWPEPDDDAPRIAVQAYAYRSPEDEHPGVGWSWMALPGTTPYTRGSELENTETSAWGRAIASLGILIDRSIASAQEVANKASEPAPHVSNGLIGTVEKGKAPADMEVRQTPDGPVYAFKLKNGRKAYQVVAQGPLAEALAVAGLEVGQRVTVHGAVEMVPFVKDGRELSYARINLTGIKGDDFELPASEAVPEPLWDDALAEIDAELAPA